MSELTQEKLKELLTYDPETGIFTWDDSRGRCKKGSKAGTLQSDGYIQIRIAGVCYYAHRLAWLYINGNWPLQEIDHRNQIKTDNKFKNLREVTRSENGQNRKTLTSNSSGFKGVCWDKRTNKWIARIKLKGKRRHLGYYEKAEDASEAYKKAQEELHTHYPDKDRN